MGKNELLELNGMILTRPEFNEALHSNDVRSYRMVSAYSAYTSVYSLTLNSGEIVSVYVLEETKRDESGYLIYKERS